MIPLRLPGEAGAVLLPLLAVLTGTSSSESESVRSTAPLLEKDQNQTSNQLKASREFNSFFAHLSRTAPLP